VTNGVVTLDDSAENVRMINGTTGIVTTVAGETACGTPGSSYYPYTAAVGCPGAGTPPATDGDGGPATSALLNYPTTLFVDQYNNLFIGENTNKRLRVVYRGGTLPGISNPVVGNIYTYAGGNASTGALGTLQVDGTPAQQISFANMNGAGIDKNGNIYILDSGTRQMWKIDPVTGIGNIIAGGPTSTNAPTAGKYCNGGSSGPVSTDSMGSGCPGNEAYISMVGSVSFDAAGNFYISNTSTVTTANEVIQELSYQNQFPSTQDGSSSSQYLAFLETASAGTTLTGRSFSLQGGTDSEFTDAGGTACTPTSTIAYKTLCVVNVKFTPSHPGARPGLMQLTSSAGTAVSEPLLGTGVGADLAIDEGTVSTIGAGLTPSGVAADLQGNVYVSDSKGGQVLKGSATGTTLTPLVSGLKNPAQIAIDNAGNLYIADAGNNRILVTTAAGATIASVGTGLSGPQGVAVDGQGNLFVADTGNNRIVTLTAEGYQLTQPILGLTPATPALSAPTQLGFDPAGNFYILDSGNSRILEAVASTGITSPVTLDSGVNPTGFAIDAAGDLYVTDSTSESVLDYYAGLTPGFSLTGGLLSPVGLAIDGDANLFIADTQMAGAVEVRRSLGNTVFPDTAPGKTTNADLTLNNVGNSALNFTLPLYSVNSALFALVPATTNGCGAGIPYAPGSTCNFTASYSPAIAGNNSASSPMPPTHRPRPTT
jgi:sugar lactone lactonase YvrE